MVKVDEIALLVPQASSNCSNLFVNPPQGRETEPYLPDYALRRPCRPLLFRLAHSLAFRGQFRFKVPNLAVERECPLGSLGHVSIKTRAPK